MTEATAVEETRTTGGARRQPSLVAAMCIALAADLVIRRVLAPVAHIDWGARPGRLLDTLDFGAELTWYAATIFVCLVAVLGLVRTVALPSEIPRGARAALGTMAVAFMPLLLLSAWRELPSLFPVYLQVCSACVAVLVMFAGLFVGRGARPKLGLVALTAPTVAYALWVFGSHLPDGPSGWARVTLWIGEAGYVTAAVVALLCFFPQTVRPRVPIAVALVSGAVAAALVAQPQLAGRLVDGFSLSLPATVAGKVAMAVAAVGYLLTVAALLDRPGTSRLRGFGLAAVALAGFQHEQSLQIGAAVVGYLCIVESLTRDVRALPTAEVWRALVRRVAAAVGAREVEVVGADGYETARVRLVREADAVEVALGRRGGEVFHAEVIVGLAPSEEAPPVALARRGAPRLGRIRGEEVATGDLAFDEAFRTFDARKLTARDRVLDDDLRPRLLASVDGWLAVWPGAGVRYRTRNIEVVHTGDQLTGLIDLLVELKNRT